MTFLQPWLLLSLPLVALPVIIHLINQQRCGFINKSASLHNSLPVRKTIGDETYRKR